MKKISHVCALAVLITLVSCGTQVAPVENTQTPVVENSVSETPVGEVENTLNEESEVPKITFEDNNFIIQNGELYFKRKMKVEYKYLKVGPDESGYPTGKIFDEKTSETYQGYTLPGNEEYNVGISGTGIVLEKMPVSNLENFKTVFLSDSFTLDQYKNYSTEKYFDTEDKKTGNSGYIEFIAAEDGENYYKITEQKYGCMGDVFGCSGETELEIIKK